jgi:hypothetical protein
MLVALGFLLACLIVVALVPAYWARAVRLTTQRIRQSVPLTEAEIRADKDRIRAHYAVRIHKLETQVEQGKLAAARQQVELNRRDAAIRALEGEVERLTLALEEHQNARRVLEQAVIDRVPNIGQRLGALEPLASAGAARNGTPVTQGADVELERLRRDLAEAEAALRAVPEKAAAGQASQAGLEGEIQALQAAGAEQASTIKRLEAALAAYEAAGAGKHLPMLNESKIAMKGKLRALQAQVDSQSELIEKLRAELAASNERHSLQSAQVRDDMRRLGAGTLPASGQARRSDAVRPRRSLAERIGQTTPQPAASVTSPARLARPPAATPAGALATPSDPAAAAADVTGPSESAAHQQPAGSGGAGAANGTSAPREVKTAVDQKRPEPPHKQRLLDRIASLDKT